MLVLFLSSLTALRAQSTIPADMLCAQTQINGDVIITWGPSTEACGPFLGYEVYASNNLAGPYALLTTIPAIGTTTYIHVGANGTVTTWYYYIVATYNCPGFTMTSSDTLDNLDPVAPNIDYVTVTASQSVLFWDPSPSPETNSYIVYRDMGGFVPIDTVYGRFTTTYTDVTGNPDLQSETYTLAARDSCDYVGPFNTLPHHTIYLTVQQINCSDSLELSWNSYINWPVGVNYYEVWAVINGDPPVKLATVPPTDTLIHLGGIQDGDDVCITVHAIRPGGTAESVSNAWCAVLDVITPQDFNVIRNASVTGATSVQIDWYPDTNADIQTWSVLRSENGGAYSNLITTAAGILPPIQTYTDNSGSPGSKSYYYKILNTDSCGQQLESGVVHTVHVSGHDNANFTNTLDWNAFEITNGSVQQYNIYRDVGTGLAFLATVDAATLTFTDDVQTFIDVVDHFCYQIEAQFDLNAPENGVNEQLSSFSNITCADQGPRIYVPNAIVPGGVNNIFLPVIIFGRDDGYSMDIFNRYGEPIFSTTDKTTGWDGTYEGKVVEMGTYAYVIHFVATNGQEIVKKGNVTVIR